MKTIMFILCCFLTPVAMAQMEPFDYFLGKVLAHESVSKIVLHADRPVDVDVLPGGTTWPPLSLDETGKIYVGNVVIDSNTVALVTHPKATLALWHDLEISESLGGFTFHRTGKTCYFSLQELGLEQQEKKIASLKSSAIGFSNSAGALLALVRQFDEYGHTSNYLVDQIDLVRCRIGYQYNLGDPDFLVELNYSTEGGWWITGSIEQTLLQSSDGRHWRKATLPPALSSLISAYVVNPWEIWLAAILPPYEASPYLLVYSGDGGVTWRNVVANDPLLQRIPAGWLEGQKRRVLH